MTRYVSAGLLCLSLVIGAYALWLRAENAEAQARLQAAQVEAATAAESLAKLRELNRQLSQVENSVRGIGDEVEAANRRLADELKEHSNAPLDNPNDGCLPPGAIR